LVAEPIHKTDNNAAIFPPHMAVQQPLHIWKKPTISLRERTASIVNSNVNLGEGTQINVSAESDKQDVFVAVEALVRAGLSGDWSDDAGNALSSLVAERTDVTYEDVETVALEVAKKERPTKDRVTGFLAQIAVSGCRARLQQASRPGWST
jgi:hypothetical protein